MRKHATVELFVALFVAALVTGCGGRNARATIETPCEGAPRRMVSWTNCHLRGADLRGAQLDDAVLHDVDLGGADLTGADLSGAQLSRVWAVDTILRDANLDGALVSGGDIQKAIYCNTTMPSGSIANGGC